MRRRHHRMPAVAGGDTQARTAKAGAAWQP